MKKRNINIGVMCILGLFLLPLVSTTGVADDAGKLTGRKYAQLARGGILYDNWPDELGIKIDRNHPSYPASGKQKGKSTWRCKECHGWDYKGKAGAYSSGSHNTGITGIRAYSNQNPDEILNILKNDVHAYSGIIPEDSLQALSLFVAYGQVDVDLYIDRASKKSIGDPANGGRIYLSTCIKCHGEDGREINFKDEKKPEFIGTISNKNPWETLHKIRWGHPGSQMIALLFLDLKQQLDVLSFCQTLPEK